ncbi:F-box domain-containing protein [Heracleum sosnowskyi]|uniref:F-box domain-containing protein n=1 Tax=Heracleum sosnowskyi TaxID=360622 RepID=A0AAD8MBP3_9APIA|nr:F-box domain-containing protein [Heracleum sosnowskyi]
MAQGQASLERLDDDEAYNILKRLMRRLSSTWKDLLNDAHLINLHRAWSQKNHLLLIVTQLSVQNHSTRNDSEEVDLLLTSMDPTDGAITYQARTKVYKDVKVLSSGRGYRFCILSMEDVIIFKSTTKEIQKLPKAVPPSDGPIRANLMQLPRSPHRSVDHPSFVIAIGFRYIKSRHVYA